MGIEEPKMPTPEEMANTKNQNETLKPGTDPEITKTETPENEKEVNPEEIILKMEEILDVLPNEKYLMEQYGAHLKRGENTSMVEIGQLMALRADLTKCASDFKQSSKFKQRNQMKLTAEVDFPSDNEIDVWENYLSYRDLIDQFEKQKKFKVYDLLKNLRELSNKLKKQQET
jgi:hypothetical protein